MDIRLFQKINLRLRYLISFLMIFIVVTLFSVILYSFYHCWVVTSTTWLAISLKAA